MLKSKTDKARKTEKSRGDSDERFEVVAEEREGRRKMHFIVHSVGGQVVDKTRIMLPSSQNPFFRRRYQDAAE